MIPQMSHIELEISNPCNEHCLHCYRTLEAIKKGFLPLEQAKSVLSQAKELGAKDVTVTGGEATLDKDWKEIVKTASDLGFCVSLFINGTLLKKEDRKQKNAIRMLKEEKMRLFVSCPAMKENVQIVAGVMSFCDDNKIRSCCDLSIFDIPNKMNATQRLDENDFEKFFDVTMADGGKLSYVWGKSKGQRDLSKIDFYDRATNGLLVSGDGSIYPMIDWYEKLGNIKKDKLSDVFYNHQLLKKIRQIKVADFEECKECKAQDFCVFCPSVHLNANGYELMKLDKKMCHCFELYKKFAKRRDEILQKQQTIV